MELKKIKEIKTLISRLLALALLGGIAYLIYWLFFKPTTEKEFELDQTPLRVEQIRSILELNTLKFQDEVVVDTFELYKSASESITGSFEKLLDYDQFKNGLKPSAMKRRLTLIVSGELLYGVNLKTKDFEVVPKGDSLIVQIPKPELLSISLNPSETEVFVENGFWSDYERQVLQRKAKSKMIATGIQLKLTEKAKAPLIKLLQQLIRTDKQLIIQFED